MSSDDANRLLRLREGTAGRTQYDGRLERTDEFLLRVLDEISAAHDRRVTELLAANTAVVERRRAAEAECARLSALAADIGRERLVLAEKLRAADFAADTYCAERDATYEKLSAERRKREAAEALVERMWPIVEAVARAFEEKKVRYEKINSDWHLRIPDHWPADMSLTMQVIRAAGALVREREEKETT